jgi:hypothetical protein
MLNLMSVLKVVVCGGHKLWRGGEGRGGGGVQIFIEMEKGCEFS